MRLLMVVWWPVLLPHNKKVPMSDSSQVLRLPPASKSMLRLTGHSESPMGVNVSVNVAPMSWRLVQRSRSPVQFPTVFVSIKHLI